MAALKPAILGLILSGAAVAPSWAFPVTIDPQGYSGRYFVHPAVGAVYADQHGVNTYDLPAGDNFIDNGSSIGGSSILIRIDGAGTIFDHAPAAAVTVSGSTVTFNNTTISVDVQNYAGGYVLQSGYPFPDIRSGNHSFVLVPGLTYSLDDGSEIAGSALVFEIDAAGTVSIVSGAATATGSTLTLANVTVRVNPGSFTGTYRIGTAFYSGISDIVLIPTLATALTAGSPLGSFTPGPCDVTPSSLGTFTFQVISSGCGPAYTASVRPPIKSDGSSVFKANRGVVPVKFMLSADGAPTCALPAATISLLRTSGAAPGPVNESDYLQPSDDGSNFRVDATACQYVYNLGASHLGPGQYEVQISINGVLVGRAAFALN